MMDYFVPHMFPDDKLLYVQGNPLLLYIDKKAHARRSFLSGDGHQLQGHACGIIFVPGGPIPKMHFFWKIPSGMAKEE
jgi:hypothetical protein